MKSISLNIALKLLSKIYKIDNILYIGIGSGEDIDLLKQLDANINQIERIKNGLICPIVLVLIILVNMQGFQLFYI